ncbi:MAG: OmpH family outer membrane protein [Phycisphaerae bacterium]|nr:OmpH family outer membrane protein [Phycisphaerae bacterium]NUQ44949.1 OmpH family outer membrane protein [Phycisphaerae bacterium]
MNSSPPLRLQPFSALIAAAVVGLAVCFAAARQPSEPASGSSTGRSTRVAAVDLVRVFNEWEQITALNNEFRKVREDLNRDADTRRKALEELEMKLRAYRPGSPDYEGVRKELVDQSIAYKVWFETKQQEVRGEEFRWMSASYETACEIIRRMAERDGWDIVMQIEPFSADAAQEELPALQAQIRARKMVYCAASNDLTRAVIDQLNMEYRAKARPPAAPAPGTP